MIYQKQKYMLYPFNCTISLGFTTCITSCLMLWIRLLLLRFPSLSQFTPPKLQRGRGGERDTHRVQAKYFISRKGCATQSAKSRNLAYTLDHVTHHQEQSRPVLEKQKVGRKGGGRCGSCGTAALFAQDTLGRPGTAASLDRRGCCCSCRYKDTPQITLGDR